MCLSAKSLILRCSSEAVRYSRWINGYLFSNKEPDLSGWQENIVHDWIDTELKKAPPPQTLTSWCSLWPVKLDFGYFKWIFGFTLISRKRKGQRDIFITPCPRVWDFFIGDHVHLNISTHIYWFIVWIMFFLKLVSGDQWFQTAIKVQSHFCAFAFCTKTVCFSGKRK